MGANRYTICNRSELFTGRPSHLVSAGGIVSNPNLLYLSSRDCGRVVRGVERVQQAIETSG